MQVDAMKALSMDLRERIVEGRKSGISAADLSKRYHVGKRTIQRWWSRYLEAGSPYQLQRGGHLKSRVCGHEEQLSQWIEHAPDLSLEELCERLRSECSVSLSPSQLCRRLKAMGYTYKKNDTRGRTKTT